MDSFNYDIIGDIHGHALELEILLQKMGYRRKSGVYSHPEGRKVIFVGDFIDRGPKIRETLHLVRDMVLSGDAQAVMGNHEFNAISFHTPHVEKGGFFRDHSFKEIHQHIETLEQFKYFDSEWADFLEWFKTLPLFLELDHIRVVHACWDPEHIKFLKANYHGITADFLKSANEKTIKPGMYRAVEETLKGKEQELPDGLTFTDKDGAVRRECRVKWWTPSEKRKLLNDVLVECPPSVAKREIGTRDRFYSYDEEKPVFFGHYWLKGIPVIENEKTICLDYSVAKGGVLVGCRIALYDKVMNINLMF